MNEYQEERPSCICATPENIRKHGGKLVVREDCRYHQLAAKYPHDHSIPWNCPTYWDGCNCAEEIKRLRGLSDWRVSEVYDGLDGQQRICLVDPNGRVHHVDL